MKTFVLLGLVAALTVVLAQSHDSQEQQRQRIVRGRDDQKQIRDGFGASTDTVDRGYGRGNFYNGQYGCPGCRGGQYGRRGPGPWRGWRGFGPGGHRRGYGPGPRWGSRGPHRMSDFFGMRGYAGDNMSYGPMRGHGMMGHHGGFFRGHGHRHRYFDEDFCPTYCSSRDSPVCGSDGQTYENRCALRMEACRTGESLTVARRGQC